MNLGTVTLMCGIDGTGKTDLLNLVQRIYSPGRPIIVKKLVSDPHKLRPLESLLLAGRETALWDHNRSHIFYDRFPIPDEYIYGIQLRTLHLEPWLELMSELSVKIVYVYPVNEQVYVQHIKDNPDEYYALLDPSSDQYFGRLLDRYSAFLTMAEGFGMEVLMLPWQSFHPRHAQSVLSFAQGKGSAYGTVRSNRSGAFVPSPASSM